MGTIVTVIGTIGGQRRSTVVNHRSTTVGRRRTTLASPDHRSSADGPPLDHRQPPVNGGRPPVNGDSGSTLETFFVVVGVLATLNLDFATTEVAPKFLDFAAMGVVYKALLH
nr:hypothetical protein [Tanacetum cinerariifolium]